MPTSLSAAPAGARMTFVLFGVFLGTLLLFGGASRADVVSLPIVRLASIAMIAVALFQLRPNEWRAAGAPGLFALAVFLIIAAQLVPLPPGLWAALPGRSFYAEAMAGVGVGDVWRPLSLTPDLTLNALLAMLPVAAAVIGLALLHHSFDRLLVPMLLAGILVSGLVGLLQMGGGGPYFYTITNPGAAVGFFSNRNHLAVLIALAFPLLACWVRLRHPDAGFRRIRTWLALCMAAASFPILLTTGSRTGLVVGALGALLAVAILAGREQRSRRDGAGFRWRNLLILIPLAVGALGSAATVFLSRDLAFSRLLGSSEGEQRVSQLPTYFEMAREYFPFGSGFGSFDAVYRQFELHQNLTIEYLNHAHNDLLQVVIEGGAPALLLLALFLAWYLKRCWSLWRHRIRSEQDLLGRTGSVMIFMLLLSSLVDYPLRTPLLAVVFTLACWWMVPRRDGGDARHEADRGVGSQPTLE